MARIEQIFPSLSVTLNAIGMKLELKEIAKSSVESGISKILVAEWRRVPDLANELDKAAEDFRVALPNWSPCCACGKYIQTDFTVSKNVPYSEPYLWMKPGIYVCKDCIGRQPYRYLNSNPFVETFGNTTVRLPAWVGQHLTDWVFYFRFVVGNNELNGALAHKLQELRLQHPDKVFIFVAEYVSEKNSRIGIWRKNDTDSL